MTQIEQVAKSAAELVASACGGDAHALADALRALNAYAVYAFTKRNGLAGDDRDRVRYETFDTLGHSFVNLADHIARERRVRQLAAEPIGV